MSVDLQHIMESFVFADCRLGSHPKVRASLYWYVDGRIRLFGRTQQCEWNPHFSQHPDYDVSSILTQQGYGRTAYIEFESQKTFYWITLPISTGDATGVLALDSESGDLVNDRNMGIAQLLAALIGYLQFYGETNSRSITPMSICLGTAMAQARREIGLSQESLAHKTGASRIALSRWESGAQPPSSGLLLRWCEGLDLLSSQHPTIVKVTDITPEVLDLLRKDPLNLRRISPEMFEHFIADRLDHMGFDVQLTGVSRQRDGGIDLIAVPKVPSASALLLAGQVKHHIGNQKTGRSAVDRLLSWMNNQFSLGLLVTNTFFTRDALWVATQEQNRKFLRLRDFEDLKRWIVGNFWDEAEWREIPESITLAPGVTVRIPKVRIDNPTLIWPLPKLKK